MNPLRLLAGGWLASMLLPTEPLDRYRFGVTNREQSAMLWLEARRCHYEFIDAPDDIYRYSLWSMNCWDALDDAFVHTNPATKTDDLARLRRMLGECRWRRGEMPALRPYHLFKEMP